MAEAEKSRLRASADSEIEWRQDAVDAGIATEEETVSLTQNLDLYPQHSGLLQQHIAPWLETQSGMILFLGMFSFWLLPIEELTRLAGIDTPNRLADYQMKTCPESVRNQCQHFFLPHLLNQRL